MKKLLFSILIFCSLRSFAVESATVPVQPENGNGYAGELSFKYGFANCYGKVSVAFGNQNLQARSYLYEGKGYTPVDLGLTEFKKPTVSGATIVADVYDGGSNLGKVEFKNVTFFSGVGCFSETYSVIEMLGLNNTDYRERFKDLRLANISIKADSRNFKVEELIYKKTQNEIAQKNNLEKEAAQAQAKNGVSANVNSSQAIGNSSAPENSAAQTKKSSNNSATTAGTQIPSQAKKDASGVKSELEKQQEIEKSVRAEQESFNKTQQTVQNSSNEASQAVGGFASGISGTGDGFGFSILSDNANDSDSPFVPFFIGLVFGKVKDPTLPENMKSFLSGLEFQAAFNLEWLGSEPEEFKTNRYSKNNRRWDILLETKLFGNFSALGHIQPYLALGYASYTDFDRRVKKIGSDWTFVTGYGLSFVGTGGVFSIGLNPDLKVLDLSFMLHM